MNYCVFRTNVTGKAEVERMLAEAHEMIDEYYRSLFAQFEIDSAEALGETRRH